MSRNQEKLTKTTRLWVQDTWKICHPEWFITLLWNDRPGEPITPASHARQFKNVFLCKLYDKRRCDRLPSFPERVGMTIFHERARDEKNRWMFHTHIHLLGEIVGMEYGWEIDWFIRSKCSAHIQKLLKTDADGNSGVVVEKWIPERHANYNYKDFFRFRDCQDGDQVLDFENSDFTTLHS